MSEWHETICRTPTLMELKSRDRIHFLASFHSLLADDCARNGDKKREQFHRIKYQNLDFILSNIAAQRLWDMGFRNGSWNGCC